MTADLIELNAGAIAWDLAESGATMCVTTRRAALVYAAERASVDPGWWTPAREVTARTRLVHSTLAGSARFHGLFDALVAATPFGPRVVVALAALISPAGGRS